MINFLLLWIDFWRNKQKLFIFLLIVFVGFLLSSALKVSLNENINHMFQDERIKKALSSNENKKVFISIKSIDSNISLHDVKAELKSRLKNKFNEQISFNEFTKKTNLFEDKFYNNIPFYLKKSDYAKIQLRIQSIDSILNKNHKLLFSPTSEINKQFIFKDPLNLMGLVFENHQNILNTEFFNSSLGEETSIIINLTKDDISSTTPIYKKLQKLQKEYSRQNVELNFFSTAFIPVVNSQQIKEDLNITLSFTIIIIYFILIIAFKNYLLPLMFVMPAIFGMIFSLALIYWIKGNISGIALGSGAVIFGIVIDYSFHFFSHQEHNKNNNAKTIKELFNPLIFSAFTTIMAFYALTLTSSKVLNDFGWFATFGLIGSLIFVLLILPIISPKINKKKTKKKYGKIKLKVSNRIQIYIATGILLTTILLAYEASNVSFDSNIENLNFFPDELKDSEKQILDIDSENNKSILLFVQEKDIESAKSKNLELLYLIEKMKNNNLIINFSNFSFFDLPKDIIIKKKNEWDDFWKTNKLIINNNLSNFSIKNKYQENAFDKFHQLINTESSFLPLFPDQSNYLIKEKNHWIAKSIIILKKKNLELVSNILKKHKINYIDKAGLATSMLEDIKNDFNFLLFYTGILVFFTLLLIYGRIELALMTFLPMLISWIWILGISAILNIQFNFVNIIISTLIFGIGDDFAIFITDGYLRKYKTDADTIYINFKSILLSALTTIIALGSLIFAKHPAINSIAPISIIGMISILLISFFLQPILYKFLILNRNKKNLAPISLSIIVSSLFSYSLFVVGSIILSSLAFILSFIPYRNKTFKPLLHLLIQKTSWLIVYVATNVKKKKFNPENINFKKPSIIIANHQSFVDILQMLMLNPKIILVVKDWVYYSPVFGKVIRFLGFVTISDGINKNMLSIKKLIDNGYSIMIFPEGSRSETAKLGRFHKGAFLISEKLKLDITPILLHGYGDAIRKNDFLINKSIISYKVLPRIKYDDYSFGGSYQERAKNIKNYFKSELISFSKERENTDFLYCKIKSNIEYKGPILEWYFKIKWRLEKNNYEFYNRLIPSKSNIYDLGCGYGFLSMYLYLKSNKRTLTCIDYDEEKINIAKNYFMFRKTSVLNFIKQNIEDSIIKNADAILLNDVLHYLDKDSQLKVLNKCFHGLNKNGIIFIRDGEKDNKRHFFTKLTEFLSTKIFRFNIIEGNLNFLSSNEIKSLANKNNYIIDIKNHSKFTSNKLFILKRK